MTTDDGLFASDEADGRQKLQFRTSELTCTLTQLTVTIERASERTHRYKNRACHGRGHTGIRIERALEEDAQL